MTTMTTNSQNTLLNAAGSGPDSSRRAKIVATLGPATSTTEMFRQLVRAGLDVARLNFSHGSHEQKAELIRMVRQVSKEECKPICILADLQGPKIRTGKLKDHKKVQLVEGERLTITPGEYEGSAEKVGTTFLTLAENLEPGSRILLSDGLIELRVERVVGLDVVCEIVNGGELGENKGINLPGIPVKVPSLTEKDEEDLIFAVDQGVDSIAVSFVRTADDVRHVKARLAALRSDAWVIAKLEKPQAVDHLDSILEASDAIMVARGDLGVEVPPEKVPAIQKHIIRRAAEYRKPVITATQMLESMIENPRPTRAEASDVANGVYEGADALMLSAESAMGAWPRETVAMMDAIIRRVEADPNWPRLMRAEHGDDADEDVDALIAAATGAAEARATACLVAYTNSGVTARRLARERPAHPVLALTHDIRVARALGLVWGLEPRVAEQPRGITAMTDEAAHLAADLGLAAPGARVLIISGPPKGAPGAANLLRIAHAPRGRRA
jgi:pyruvate kinase